jgi:hypothetical protein
MIRSRMGRGRGRWARPGVAASAVHLAATLLALHALADAPREDPGARQRQQTRELLQRLARGLFGARSSGYIADMGRLPESLADLAAPSGTPLYSTGHGGGVGMGYDGPYVRRAGETGTAFVDAWGTPIDLLASGGAVQLRSAGPDRDPSTIADNLLHPPQPRPYLGTVAVEIIAVPPSDGPGTPLDGTYATVDIAYASDGAEATAAATYRPASGRFELTGVHVGRHYVVARATVPPANIEAVGTALVDLRGARAHATIQLRPVQTTVVCHVASGTTLSLESSGASAHLAHGDTLGICASGEVTLCHLQSLHTLSVAGPAARAHLAHGDTLGACETARICHDGRLTTVLRIDLNTHVAHGDTQDACGAGHDGHGNGGENGNGGHDGEGPGHAGGSGHGDDDTNGGGSGNGGHPGQGHRGGSGSPGKAKGGS